MWRQSKRWMMRLLYGVITLAVLLCLLLLVALWIAPLQWQGIGWNHGVVVQQLQVQSGGCLPVKLQQLRATGLRPLTVDVERVVVTPCEESTTAEDDSGVSLKPLAWLAWWPIKLTAASVDYPLDDTTTLSVGASLEQINAQLKLTVTQPANQLTLRYRFDDEAWQLHGDLSGADINPDITGRLTLQGAGHWDLQWPPQQGSALGQLTLQLDQAGYGDDAVSGEVTAALHSNHVEIAPFRLEGKGPLVIASERPVRVPFANAGDVQPQLALTYQALQLKTLSARVTWQPDTVHWQGELALSGDWQGYQLAGRWNGTVDSKAGIDGALTLQVKDDVLQLAAQSQVQNDLHFSRPVTVAITGDVDDVPFQADLSARIATDEVRGEVALTATPKVMAVPAPLTLNSGWRWQLQQPEQVVLAPDLTLSLASLALPDMLVRSVRATAATPLTVSAQGVQGSLRVSAGGVLKDRWRLPAVTADLTLCGWCFELRGKVAEWDMRLYATGAQLLAAPQGRVSVAGRLVPAMTRGLPASLEQGTVDASGTWKWSSQLDADATVNLAQARARSGSISAEGINGTAKVHVRGARWQVDMPAPMEIALLDVGIPVTDITMKVAGSDTAWQVKGLSATLLGGELRAARLDWPSANYQDVTLQHIDSGAIVALQNQPAFTVSGPVGARVPVQLLTDSFAVKDGEMYNEAPLHFALQPGGALDTVASGNRWLTEAFKAINVLDISALRGELAMQPNGELTAALHIQGKNANYARPVVLNYSHRENIFTLLQSLRIADQLVESMTGGSH